MMTSFQSREERKEGTVAYEQALGEGVGGEEKEPTPPCYRNQVALLVQV